MYVKLQDIQARFKEPYLSEQLGTELTQWQVLLPIIIERVSAYTRHWYDMTTEFAKDCEASPDTRNQFILSIVLDLLIYDLHKSGTPRNVPSIWVESKEEAYRTLLDIQKGRLTLELPTKVFETETDEQGFSGQTETWGSMNISDDYGSF